MNALLSRPWVVWVLCLGLVLPGVGQAAQEQSAPEPPSEEASQQRWLLPDEQARKAAWWTRTNARRGPRILGEVGAGLLTGGVLGLLGGYVGGSLCAAILKPEGLYGGLRCLPHAGLGAAAGMWLGLPLGVWWAGDALGGNGSLLASLSGSTVGLLGAFAIGGVGAAVNPEFRDVEVVLAVSLPVLLVAGSVIGYEVSQRAPRRWAARGGLQPLLAVTPRSTVVGLSGHF